MFGFSVDSESSIILSLSESNRTNVKTDLLSKSKRINEFQTRKILLIWFAASRGRWKKFLHFHLKFLKFLKYKMRGKWGGGKYPFREIFKNKTFVNKIVISQKYGIRLAIFHNIMEPYHIHDLGKTSKTSAPGFLNLVHLPITSITSNLNNLTSNRDYLFC